MEYPEPDGLHRRPATTGDSYFVEVYDPAHYNPRWLSPLVGHGEPVLVGGLPGSFALYVPYAWDVVVLSADGGTGISRMARLTKFSSRGISVATRASEPWPFPEDLPLRSAESIANSP